MRYVIFALIFITYSEGEAQYWKSLNGPPGSGESIMAVNPNGDMFVISDAIERSTDNGLSWVRVEFPSFPESFTDIHTPKTGVVFGLVQSRLEKFTARGCLALA